MRSDRATSRRAAGRTRGPALLTLFLSAALAAGACATGGSGSSGGGSGFEERPVTVEVENQSWSTVHVYVVAGGQFQSLGQLTSQNTAAYEVPGQLMGHGKQIRLAADPIGSSEAFISDGILVEPGDRIRWTLTQPLSHSHVFID